MATAAVPVIVTSATALLSGSSEGAAVTFLGLPVWIWQLANLVLFFGLLWHFLRKPLGEAFTGRQERVAQELSEARAARVRAEALARELEARLGTIDAELQALREKAEADGKEEKAALAQTGEAEAERFLSHARLEIESRVRAGKRELAAYAGDLAVEMAREMLAKQVTAEDQKRLLDEGVAAVGGRP